MHDCLHHLWIHSIPLTLLLIICKLWALLRILLHVWSIWLIWAVTINILYTYSVREYVLLVWTLNFIELTILCNLGTFRPIYHIECFCIRIICSKNLSRSHTKPILLSTSSKSMILLLLVARFLLLGLNKPG